MYDHDVHFYPCSLEIDVAGRHRPSRILIDSVTSLFYDGDRNTSTIADKYEFIERLHSLLQIESNLSDTITGLEPVRTLFFIP